MPPRMGGPCFGPPTESFPRNEDGSRAMSAAGIRELGERCGSPLPVGGRSSQTQASARRGAHLCTRRSSEPGPARTIMVFFQNLLACIRRRCSISPDCHRHASRTNTRRSSLLIIPTGSHEGDPSFRASLAAAYSSPQHSCLPTSAAAETLGSNASREGQHDVPHRRILIAYRL